MELTVVKKLTVKYNGRVVGYLADLSGEIGFQYDEGWLKDGFALSPFSLPLTNKVFVNHKKTFNGLYGVFADSLPDGWGELLFRRMLARQGFNADRVSPLTRLALVNDYGMGGLQYEPSFSEMSTPERFDLDMLAAEADKIWNDEMENVNLDEVYRLGGSSGGARPKAHIKVGEDCWIVKFPCSYDSRNAGKKEFEANKLARDAGINVNEFKLFPSKKYGGFFGAKRFDRDGTNRVHMVSLSSMLETSHRIPNLDYCHLFQVVQKICIDQSDMYEVFRRMAFNVFYGNKDDHGKNFAFLYDESARSYKLSPAYDITKTVDKAEHEMTVNGNGNPSEDDMLAVADCCGLQKAACTKILESVKKITQKRIS
ncbi:MAG: type II toxin-antitoxin system HipA family toxin [Fibrobacter sp.]|nr:type II toxin-antitoxin system HipA family toxin [Fibrobacter sp.]